MDPIEALRMRGVGVGKKLKGDATAADVRAGRTFSNAQSNENTGTLTVRSLVPLAITPGVNNIVKQAGIYDGDITILGDLNLIATNIKNGIDIFGVLGTAPLFSPGATTIHASNTVNSTQSTAMTKIKDVTVDIAGTYRVSFNLKTSHSAATARAQIYVNGAARGTSRSTTSTAIVTYTEDIMVAAGDLVQIYALNTNNTATTEVSSMKFGVGLTFITNLGGV